MEEEKKSAVTPLSMLNPKNYGEKDIATERYNICLQCPELIKVTKQCRRCGCFMVAKTKLANATCPLGKWQLWYNKIMPDRYEGFWIPELTDDANIVTAFEDFTDSLVEMVDDEGNERFSGLLDVDVYQNVGQLTDGKLNGSNLNTLVVLENVGTFGIDDSVPEGWNVAITHLSSGNTLPPPTGVNTNWTEPLPAFVIASLVKIIKSDGTPFYVSTFGGTGVTP